MKTNECDVLIVEDKVADFELALRALQKGGIVERIAGARDGVEALDFIFCRGEQSSRDPADAPKVILLDLKLPRLSGFEVLQELKKDPRTAAIPVIVLTASRERRDLDVIRGLGVAGYIVKPADFLSLAEAVRKVTNGAVPGGAAADKLFHGGRETILTVEDDVLFGAEVTAYLTRIGYRVITATNVTSALAAWQEHRTSIGLVLTDIDLSEGGNGMELAGDIVQEEPGIPIIYLSSSKDVLGPRNPSLEEGVNFLSKPMLMPDVARAIRRALDVRAAATRIPQS